MCPGHFAKKREKKTSEVKTLCFRQFFKCPKSFHKGPKTPSEILLGHLKHYLKHVFFTLDTCLKVSQNVPDTFSDTLELPDTLPDTVWDTF